MAHYDGFVRTDDSPALINNDAGGLEQYRMNRLRAKQRNSLEEQQRILKLRIEDLELRLAVVEHLLKERD